MKIETKWQLEYKKEVDSISNLEVVEEALSLSAGDDYDGGFTDRGIWYYEYIKRELSKRLKKCGFIDKDLEMM